MSNILESYFDKSAPPLVFLRPVGFTPDDALRLMSAAKQMSDVVRWRLPPPGVKPDAYLAHASCVAEPLASPLNQKSGQDDISVTTPLRLHVDAQGRYQGAPVCVLGADAASVWHPSTSPAPLELHSRDALADLFLGLKRTAQHLVAIRTYYALGREAWTHRQRWKTHQLHVSNKGLLLAVIDPQRWCIHLRTGVSLEQIEAGNTIIAPQTLPFAAEGFEMLALESALWAFTKRCPASLLDTILPSAFLRTGLLLRRPTTLSAEELGKDCALILQMLGMRAYKADELQQKLRLTRPALMRSLAGLAFVRAIRGNADKTTTAAWFGWLPQTLRHRVFGHSSLPQSTPADL